MALEGGQFRVRVELAHFYVDIAIDALQKRQRLWCSAEERRVLFTKAAVEVLSERLQDGRGGKAAALRLGF